MQAPAKAPVKAPIMSLQYEPEDDFQCRTYQYLYFSGRENLALGHGRVHSNTNYERPHCCPVGSNYVSHLSFTKKM